MPIIDKKTIAKNTALLYFRMLLVQLINLYIARVALSVLGVEDFGIYEAIGAIVLMFAFLNNTMATAAQRFYAVELGVENHTKLKQTFSITVLIFVAIAIIIGILTETVGWWYLKSKMNLPVERVEAAMWVFHFAVFSIMASIVTTPFLAIITAREKMQAWAYMSILEVLFKMGIIFILIYFQIDKLKLYAVLLFFVQILISSAYIIYSKLTFPECKVKFYWNKKMFMEIFSFAGWNLLGSLSMTMRSQGINLLLNSFFGVLLNAARGIAYKMYNAMVMFVTNFFNAVRPQIIKSYSADNEDKSGEMMNLVFQSSKFCFYLILVLSIPILIETESILEIWLTKNNVPDYTPVFTRLVIINAIIESLANPFVASIHATGKIKMYQIVTGSIILLILPVSYLFLRWGFPPQSTMYISIVSTVMAHIGRTVFMNKLLKMNILNYLKQVILPVSAVTILSFILPLLYSYCFCPSFWRVVGVCGVTLMASAVIIYFVGLTNSERAGLKRFVRSKTGRR